MIKHRSSDSVVGFENQMKRERHLKTVVLFWLLTDTGTMLLGVGLQALKEKIRKG